MTTIAYKEGIVAYDSLATCNGTVIDHDCDKKLVERDVVFFFCGHPADFNKMVAAYFSKEDTPAYESHAIVVDKGCLYNFGINEDGAWSYPIGIDKVYAIGSGADHAYTAMDMGTDAKTAIKMAKLRDTHTGGKIRIFKIK